MSCCLWIQVYSPCIWCCLVFIPFCLKLLCCVSLLMIYCSFVIDGIATAILLLFEKTKENDVVQLPSLHILMWYKSNLITSSGYPRILIIRIAYWYILFNAPWNFPKPWTMMITSCDNRSTYLHYQVQWNLMKWIYSVWKKIWFYFKINGSGCSSSTL